MIHPIPIALAALVLLSFPHVDVAPATPAPMEAERTETADPNAQLQSILASRSSKAWLRIETLDATLYGRPAVDANRALLLMVHGTREEVQLDQVVSVWQQGIPTWKGSLTGAAIGSTLGFFLTMLAPPFGSIPVLSGEPSRTENSVRNGWYGALAGGILGVLMGGLLATQTWDQVYP